GEVLLAPTRIYVAEAAALQARCKVKGHVHVTGGGFFDNIPRVLPAGLGCAIQTESWTRPPIFDWLQDKGGVTREEMYRTFNMGMGFLAVLGPDDVAAAQELGWTAIGTINETGSVTLC
ncbi:MAG: phosphoribosylformylglycinamidine cyclo-ligase, partial [Chlamydiia bacterium]|nr:phosphoribosylformylglycinamidine cyclo-ligase [Chlamydiia bacterium]